MSTAVEHSGVLEGLTPKLLLCGHGWMFLGWAEPGIKAVLECGAPLPPHNFTTRAIIQVPRWIPVRFALVQAVATHNCRAVTLAAPIWINKGHCAEKIVRSARVCTYG